MLNVIMLSVVMLSVVAPINNRNIFIIQANVPILQSLLSLNFQLKNDLKISATDFVNATPVLFFLTFYVENEGNENVDSELRRDDTRHSDALHNGILQNDTLFDGIRRK